MAFKQSNKRRVQDEDSEDGSDFEFRNDLGTKSMQIKLDAGKRYAHTSTNSYFITMASLQPNDKILPNCACKQINKERQKTEENSNRVIVIIEHDLKEHILCILDNSKFSQCKLNLKIQPGEQVAFKTIGKIPVQLLGVTLK